MLYAAQAAVDYGGFLPEVNSHHILCIYYLFISFKQLSGAQIKTRPSAEEAL